MTAQKPRQIAARILLKRLSGDNYTENLLESELTVHPLSSPDRGLCQELVYGVVRWQAALDWLIARKTAGRDQKPMLQILLQLGLYQMFWLDRIPNHAAVNEAVELAKTLGFGPQAGFINAVLRGYARERAETEKLLADLKVSRPSVGFSHPEWLYERWQARWGTEKATSLMAWNNSPPPTWARVNTLKTTTEKLTAQWEIEGVKYLTGQWDWAGAGLTFQLESHPPLSGLRSFQDGHFYIQDPSTLLAVRELDPQPGETVLDLCAAPGGKTTFIAQCMQNRGLIVARDNAPDRLELIRENCDRLGVTCVTTVAAPVKARVTDDQVSHSFTAAATNATAANHEPQLFDRILVDAPCSNTGVMRRRVDLRWRIRPEEIDRLRATQLELLNSAAAELKPGGTLVYSTCSLEPEENRDVVKQFLTEQPGYTLIHERELLPFVDGVDGAYVAKLQRVED